jgi:hypothetical protein
MLGCLAANLVTPRSAGRPHDEVLRGLDLSWAVSILISTVQRGRLCLGIASESLLFRQDDLFFDNFILDENLRNVGTKEYFLFCSVLALYVA